MRLIRQNGTYAFEDDGKDPTVATAKEQFPAYLEAVPRYLAALEPAFQKAKERCEFEFLMSLLRVRGLQDAGWDPYETTIRAIPALKQASERADSFEARRHIGLVMYCHILEASEPYELLSNLIGVAVGERFKTQRFPRKIMPTKKIESLAKQAQEAGMPQVAQPLQELWDRDVRNAISHSDYSIYGSEVRILSPSKILAKDEVGKLINGSLAYHDALEGQYNNAIAAYTEPKRIRVHPGFSRVPGREEYAVVIVRQGHGAVGLKHGWRREELSEEGNRITWLVGRFTREESALLDKDPDLALLPATDKAG